jgi:undecaprenyl-diphosphatase
MIDTLELWDQQLTMWLNTALYHPFFQELMWIISTRIIWVPLYILLFVLILNKTGWKKASLFLVMIGVAIGLTDLISVHLFKEVFLRYRPSHNFNISNQLHLYITDNGPYKGGEYGFVSSHAANFGALTLALIIHTRSYLKWITALMLSVSFLVCLSRICLGVHYVSDVVVGWMLGATISTLIFTFVYPQIEKRIS